MSYKPWKPRPRRRWRIINTPQIWAEGGRKMPRHLFIPDTQIKWGVPIHHLAAAGNFAAAKKPDVIVLAGDMGDFPSCSAWDKTKFDFGLQSYQRDMLSLELGLQVFLAPILAESEKTGWWPRLLLTEGNHEDRVRRVLQEADQAKFREAVRLPAQLYRDYGIEVIPFLEPVLVDGIVYCHYFPNPLTGRPLGGMMPTMLKNVGFSFTMGHVQVLETGNRTLANGQVHRGLKAGAFYLHNEDYKGPQGNLHWRGIIVKNEVDGYGDYSLADVGIDYLVREWYDGPVIRAKHPDPEWTGITI